MPSRRWAGLAIALLIGTLLMCAAPQDLTVAEEGVGRFHEQFSSGQFAAIYAEADPALQEGGEAEFAEVMRRLREQYGDVRSSELTASKWQIGNVLLEDKPFSGTFVIMAYRTEFSSGPATETFTWRMTDGRAVLMGYVVEPESP